VKYVQVACFGILHRRVEK